jgi:2-phosphoglycerate kinase
LGNVDNEAINQQINQEEIKRQVCQAMIIKYQAKLRSKFELWRKFNKITRLTESKKKIKK